MSKRHDDALFIAAGACNPSGIAHSIVDACREIRAEPNHAGTAQITSDPAIKLMVHQLAFICGIVSGAEEFAKEPHYSAATAACQATKPLDHAAKAVDIWRALNESEKHGVRFGMFPAGPMQAAEAEGFKAKELSVALMNCAKHNGGMRA